MAVVATEEPQRVATSPLERIERKVHGDAHEIGLELAVAAELRERAVKLHERLLSNVFCIGTTPEHCNDRRGHRALVAVDELREGSVVAASRALDEFSVGWESGVGHECEVSDARRE